MSMGAIGTEHHLHRGSPVLTAVGHAAAVVGGGLLLLNAAFAAYAAWFQVIHQGLRAVVGPEGPMPESWALAANAAVLIGWLLAVRWATVWMVHSWPTGLGTAIWLAVPTASVLLPIGIALVDYPVAVVLTLCGALVLGVLWLMARTHQPWEQMLSIAWVAVALAAMVLLGIDI
jgi:hypothetical protein